ncbi:hypothetical protein [Mycolicibacterium sp. P1-5]|uniref:hypothetical protein n=1 Tax=Mycolicibacterium sp. P1-5 TaxID=2024617 RepID=UPI0011EDC0AB|nr:hypothetical protein [Mycolicibacterium sp. P1-5]KAA0103746.1 hypothetical protein CIW47_22165 [Mycolicibacterium sp. P1-5]
MTSGRPVVVRALCALGAVAALLLAVVAGNDLYFAGFPDSHLTEYDKAAEIPKRVLMWVEWAFVVGFPLLVVSRIAAKTRFAWLFAGLVALALVAIVQWVGLPWYFINHRGLDNGIGG